MASLQGKLKWKLHVFSGLHFLMKWSVSPEMTKALCAFMLPGFTELLLI